MPARLKAQAEEESKAESAPTMLALLWDAYVPGLEARGKSWESVIRAEGTRERLEGSFGA
jgi:hypothetical protein